MDHRKTSRLPVVDMDAHPPLAPMNADYIGRMDADLFFARLNRAGIDVACGRLTPDKGFFDDHSPEEAIQLLNRGALELARVQSRYLPALWVHPDCVGVSVRQMEEYVPHGVWMLEIDAKWLEHPGTAAILSHAQSLGMVVSLHSERIEQAGETAAQYPDLTMLAGGLNSVGYMPEGAFRLLGAHSNLLLNLSGMIWGGNYVLHEWTQRIGPDRLVFGTGYPDGNPASRLAAVRWELRDQPDSVRETILSVNAGRLLGVERSGL